MIFPLALPLPLLIEIGVVAGVYALIARRPKLRKREELSTLQTGSASAVRGTMQTAR
jgi:hypothetical protein